MSSIFGALIDPVELIPPTALGGVHFIAIGGAGMSGIAALYAELGLSVSGSDQADSAALQELATLGVRTHVGHTADQLGSASTVVVSSAIREDNPELRAAQERGLRIWHRSAALGALMLGRRGIAVGGTHGKTTTSGMLAHILTATGTDPGYVVGAPLATTGAGHRLGTGPFVVEADESDGSFRQYPADVAVVTNIEADHLDNWGTAEAYLAGFGAFTGQAGLIVANGDDPGVRELSEGDWITFGEGATVRCRLTDIELGGVSGTPGSRSRLAGAPMALTVPGRHNIFNAAAAVLSAHTLGVDLREAAEAVGGFRGTHRRYMLVGTAMGVSVFDDYAHHPTELTATLSAARSSVADGNRVIACFQPHLFSRTRDFADDFGAALALADEVVLLDIYPAREEPIPGVTSQLLVQTTQRHGGSVQLVGDREAVPAAIAGLARPGDVVLLLGAGDITRLGPAVLAGLPGREDAP